MANQYHLPWKITIHIYWALAFSFSSPDNLAGINILQGGNWSMERLNYGPTSTELESGKAVVRMPARELHAPLDWR